MSQGVDFSNFLSKPVGEIKEVLLPEGHYAARILKYETKESAGANGKAKRPMLALTVQIDSAYDDVDATQLPADGLTNIKRTTNFLLDADFGLIALRKAMEAAGIEMDPQESIGSYLDQMENRAVKVYVKHRPYDKNEPDGRLIDDLDKFLPVQ